MPGISMCLNKDCPLRRRCYRFMAKPDGWQSYSNFDPKDLDCFMEIEIDCTLNEEEE